MDVRTVCLGVLTLGDASGYEIRKMFEDGPFQYFTDAGFGSIYPALKKLHDAGHVTLREQEQESRPDKKIYSITPEGREAFSKAIRGVPAADKFRSDFLLALFFEDFLPKDMLAEIVDERIAWYRDKLGQLQDCDRSGWGAGPTFVNRFGRAVYRSAMEFLEENRDALVEAASETRNTEAAE